MDNFRTSPALNEYYIAHSAISAQSHLIRLVAGGQKQAFLFEILLEFLLPLFDFFVVEEGEGDFDLLVLLDEASLFEARVDHLELLVGSGLFLRCHWPHFIFLLSLFQNAKQFCLQEGKDRLTLNTLIGILEKTCIVQADQQSNQSISLIYEINIPNPKLLLFRFCIYHTPKQTSRQSISKQNTLHNKYSLIILVVPDLLHDVGEVGKVDFFGEGHVGSLGGYDDIVDHIANFHGEFVGFVDVGGAGGVGFGDFAPLAALVVPLLLVLHREFKVLNYTIRQLNINNTMDDEIQIQMGEYVFTEKYCIGQGSFGKVYRGKNVRTGREVAIKQMDGQLITEQEISREIAILKQLKHPNIVEYQDAFQNNGYFYIVTQYCRGGDLRNLLDSGEEEEQEQKEKKILEMLWQVCEGFKYLRKFDIIHRDLKPSNILIQNGLYKIADFGLAKKQNVHKSVYNQDLLGVPIYVSPQILSKNYYTYKCDVWSMGIIVFEMLYEHLPWKARDIETLFFQIMNHPRPFAEKKQPHSPIFDVIFEKTLSYLQKGRASWQELLAIRHSGKAGKQQSKKRKSKIEQNLNFSVTKVSKSISPEQAELLSHIFYQGKSLQNELIEMTNPECLSAFFSAIVKYLREGLQFKDMLRDCCFVFLKLIESNLYLQLMEYQRLQQSRSLLVFLQLIHDYMSKTENSTKITKSAFKSSLMNDDISEFAASVISKISTLMLSDKNHNIEVLS